MDLSAATWSRPFPEGTEAAVEVVGAVRPDKGPGGIKRYPGLPAQDQLPVLMPYPYLFRPVLHGLSYAFAYPLTRSMHELGPTGGWDFESAPGTFRDPWNKNMNPAMILNQSVCVV